MRLVDLGCGGNKAPGAVGVDIYPYPGVDVVCDLNTSDWPLESGAFDRAVAMHVIEHMPDALRFMKEVHRILKPGGELEIRTPHFSACDSYSDVTHVRHLSTRWYQTFLADGYLSVHAGTFELVESKVVFGKSIGASLGRLYIALRGLARYERSAAFRFPAHEVRTVLRKPLAR